MLHLFQKNYVINKMKKFLLLSTVLLAVTACQTMDSVKSGFSNSMNSVGNLFTSNEQKAEKLCPSFSVSDELDNYYEIPGASEDKRSAGLSSATIENMTGECRIDDSNKIITVSLDIDFTAQSKGATNDPLGTSLEIPYFIAVLDENNEILAKDTFSIPLNISAAEVKTYHKEKLQQNIPFTEETNPASYQIITGFQLSPSELALSKAMERKKIVEAKVAKTNKVPVSVADIKPAAGYSNKQPVIGADPFAGR